MKPGNDQNSLDPGPNPYKRGLWADYAAAPAWETVEAFLYTKKKKSLATLAMEIMPEWDGCDCDPEAWAACCEAAETERAHAEAARLLMLYALGNLERARRGQGPIEGEVCGKIGGVALKRATWGDLPPEMAIAAAKAGLALSPSETGHAAWLLVIAMRPQAWVYASYLAESLGYTLEGIKGAPYAFCEAPAAWATMSEEAFTLTAYVAPGSASGPELGQAVADTVFTLHFRHVRAVCERGREARFFDYPLTAWWWALLDHAREGELSTCEHCGKPFIAVHTRGVRKRFCCTECRDRAKRERIKARQAAKAKNADAAQ